MLSIRRFWPAMVSIGLLVSMVFWLPGVAASPQRATAVAERPVSASVASPAWPVGYSSHVTDQPDPSRYVALIESGGATSLRTDVSWAFVEPTQGRFDWSGPDEIVAQAAEHHLNALLIIDTTPMWASGGSASNPDWAWLPPRNPATYGVFAAAVVARYRPGGAFWRAHPDLPRYMLAGVELWNEENVSFFWGDQTPNPQLYTAMVVAAYSRIKRLDPVLTVVTGGLAPAGAYDDVTCTGHDSSGHDASAWNGVSYLQALYADGIHGHFDAVGWHAYHYWSGATAAQMLAYNRCSAWSQMASTPVSVRSLMKAHGDAAKRVWITETGAPTCVANATYTCVSAAQQASLATDEAGLWRTLSWAGGFYWYDIRDDGTSTTSAEAHFGAVSADDTPKPAYHALAQAWS